MTERTLETTTVEGSKAAGTQVVGNHTWVTLAKAWNEDEGWMKSTKAMEVPGGVLIQATTFERATGLAEALAFVPYATVDVDPETGLGTLRSTLEGK